MKQTHYLLLPFFLFISFYAKAQDLSGGWQGVSYIDVFNPRYYIFTLNLKQTGNTINGIGKVEEVGTSYYGIQRISGTVINNVFNFEDIEVIEKNLPSRDTGLCWRKGELIFEPTQERIHGRLESTCFPIRVDLYRLTIKTDTVICSPRNVNIQATGQNLRWYKDSLKQVLVDTGKVINIFVDKKTKIYVTQTIFNTESPSIPITIYLRNDFKNQSYTICQGNSITVGDTIYQTSGVYTKKLVNSYGCDSIILTNLIVNPSYKISNNLNLCTGEKVIVGDTIYQTTGIYTKILKTVLGCDSVITTNLTVNNIKNFKQNKVLCEGQEISVGDTIYRTSGNYLKKLKAFSGCDSLVETNLIIKLNQLTRQNLKICDNQTVTVGDTVYKTSGIYTRKLKTTEGCDSTVITDLTVNPIQQISQKLSICEGESVIVGDTIYHTTGTYTRRLKTLAGCDSLVSTQLSVFPVFKKTQTVSLCEGESLLVGDTVYRTTGIYTRKLRTSTGCDSLITTQLTLNTAKKTEQNIRLCAGKSISVGDTIYRTEGTYTRKLRSAAGCDSLVISYVSVVNEMRFNQKKTICEGSYMTVGDTTYRTTGIYEKRFRSSEGCDSIVTTDLKVINLALQTITRYFNPFGR